MRVLESEDAGTPLLQQASRKEFCHQLFHEDQACAGSKIVCRTETLSKDHLPGSVTCSFFKAYQIAPV
jgi:hypothetical protein